MKALSDRIRVLSGMPSTLLGICCTLAIASSVSAQEADNAMLKYGLSFLKTPYVAHTLEVNDEEKLVVNFDEVDCTTFVEYVLALSLSPVKDGAIDKADYARNLQSIRYRDGKLTVTRPACITLPIGLITVSGMASWKMWPQPTVLIR